KRGVEMNRDFLFKVIRFLFVILVAILSVFLLIYLSKLTAPFIIGALLALIINSLLDFLQIKTKMSRGLSVFLLIVIIFFVLFFIFLEIKSKISCFFFVFSSIFIILVFISTIITLLVNEIISGFTYLSNVVPEKFNQFTIFIENFYSTKIIPIYNNLLIMFED